MNTQTAGALLILCTAACCTATYWLRRQKRLFLRYIPAAVCAAGAAVCYGIQARLTFTAQFLALYAGILCTIAFFASLATLFVYRVADAISRKQRKR